MKLRWNSVKLCETLWNFVKIRERHLKKKIEINSRNFWKFVKILLNDFPQVHFGFNEKFENFRKFAKRLWKFAKKLWKFVKKKEKLMIFILKICIHLKKILIKHTIIFSKMNYLHIKLLYCSSSSRTHQFTRFKPINYILQNTPIYLW